MGRDVGQMINRITLKIRSAELEKDFRNDSIYEKLTQFRFAYLIGIFFYSAFMIIDTITYPDLADEFLLIRLTIVVPVLFIALFSSFFPFYILYARAINLFAVMISGLGIILMAIIGAENTLIPMVYGSMILIMIFLYAFFLMPYLEALAVGSVLMGGYLAVEYFLVGTASQVFLLHLFNLAGANLAGVCVAYFMEYETKKAYLLKRFMSESIIKDPLTDMFNRHYFEDMVVPDIEAFIARSRAIRHMERRLGDVRTAKYGLFMVDIDYFKRVNDTFGHHSGDLVLQQLSRLLLQSVRKTDDVLRFGGEEFMIVMKLTTEAYLIDFMKSVGRKVAEYDFIIEGGGIIGCTISMGLVVIPNNRSDEVSELVRYADRALYRSKDRGRNRGHRAYVLQGEVDFEEISWV